MTPYSLVLADDHVLFRQGLRQIIERWAGLRVIGEAGDGLELLELLKGLAPNLVILDISMPNLRGIEAIHKVKAEHPSVKILVVTMHREKEYLAETMAAGASGYLLKDDPDTHLLAAIEKIRQGRVYVSPRLFDQLADLAVTGRGSARALAGERLTLREREILKLIAEGKTSKEVADLLCISHRTVEHHRASFMEKLNAKRVADVVKYAIARGYLQAS
jgi:two-component system, NarL family, response regulator NreC